MNWKEFTAALDVLVEEGDLIHGEVNATSNDEELNRQIVLTKEWVQKGVDLLGDPIIPVTFGFANDFRNSGNNGYRINREIPFEKKRKDQAAVIASKLTELYVQKRILSVCDLVTNPESVLIESRSSFTTDQTINLLLDKLYELYDNMLYPVKPILEGNGVPIRRHYEEHDFVKLLLNQGLVESQLALGQPANAQLSVNGRLYVEEQRSTTKPDYSKIPISDEALQQTMDIILHKVSMMEFGQEIIFNELEELKELRGKIKNRTWGQLLKVKLVDLVADKVLDKETVQWIYEEFTKTKLELPF